MNYNVEDLKLYKERKENENPNIQYYIYKMEKTFSEKEKIEFIDKYWEEKGNKNMATYMLNLIDKFNKDKANMPKDQYGKVKTVSLKAWLKKNDTLRIVDDWFQYGSYYFCHTEFLSFSSNTPLTRWGSRMPYYGQEGKIVDFWFHLVLNDLRKQEEVWYKNHNSMYQKVKQIEGYCANYGAFGIKLFGLVGWNGQNVLDDKWLKSFGYKKPTEEELDKMLEVYQEVDAIMTAKTKEIQERLGWELQEKEEE